MILIITCNDDELSGGVVCLGPNIQSWMLLGAGDGGKLNDDDESRSPQEIVKKSILDVDFKRKIIKLLHLWPGTFLLLFYFECFDQFWSYSNFYPIKNIADKNFMTRMFRRSTVSWSPSENMWNVLLLRILAPPMLARYVTVPGFLIFEV